MEYIFRILVLVALLFFAVEQFGASFDSSQWCTKVMGDGEHHVFSGLQKLRVLTVGDFQQTLVPAYPVQIPMDNEIQEDGQRRDEESQQGDRMKRAVAYGNKLPVTLVKSYSGIRLKVPDNPA